MGFYMGIWLFVRAQNGCLYFNLFLLASYSLACEVRMNLAEFFWFCCMEIKGE